MKFPRCSSRAKLNEDAIEFMRRVQFRNIKFRIPNFKKIKALEK